MSFLPVIPKIRTGFFSLAITLCFGAAFSVGDFASGEGAEQSYNPNAGTENPAAAGQNASQPQQPQPEAGQAPAAPQAGAAGADGAGSPAAQTVEEEAVADFEHEDTFIDIPDALRSRQFVHRAILSTIIHDTTKFNLDSFYINQLLGFNAVYQPSNRGGKSFAKYVTGAVGVAFGYVSKGGHAAELGFELSGVSNIFIDYRYFYAAETLSVWPFAGFGVGKEIGIHLADPPIEAQIYQGGTSMGFVTIGALVPLVDVGIKAEARFNFYGLDRLMLTTGIGVIFFL